MCKGFLVELHALLCVDRHHWQDVVGVVGLQERHVEGDHHDGEDGLAVHQGAVAGELELKFET